MGVHGFTELSMRFVAFIKVDDFDAPLRGRQKLGRMLNLGTPVVPSDRGDPVSEPVTAHPASRPWRWDAVAVTPSSTIDNASHPGTTDQDKQ